MSLSLDARGGTASHGGDTTVAPGGPFIAATPGLQVIRRNGSVTQFDAGKITVAMTKAFLAVEGGRAAASRRVHEVVEELTRQVLAALTRRGEAGRTFHIEEVQDQVELALMRGEHHKVARTYVLYREERARERAAAKPTIAHSAAAALHVKQADGTLVALDDARLTAILEEACAGLSDVAPEPILAEARRNLYDGITLDELALAPIMAARTLIEQEPNYAFVSARLLLDKLRAEALSFVHGRPEQATQAQMAEGYAEYFPAYVAAGIKAELLDPERDQNTLYCTVLFFAPDGTLLGKHRKLMPTAAERLVWGFGDGSTLPAFATPLGKLGAVICWENYMPMLRMAMYAKGVSLYCAPTADDRETWGATMRHIALEGRCFVFSACQFTRRSDYPADYPIDGNPAPDTILMRGGSCIVGPLGQMLAERASDQDAVLTAEIDPGEVARGKYDFDVTGHYARPDVFRLMVNERPQPAVQTNAPAVFGLQDDV